MLPKHLKSIFHGNYVRLLNSFNTRNHNRQANYSDNWIAWNITIKSSNYRSCQEHSYVKDNTPRNWSKTPRKIQIIGILFLDQCSAQSTIHKYLQNCREYCYESNRSIILWWQKTCKNNWNDKRNQLSSTPFSKTPNKIFIVLFVSAIIFVNYLPYFFVQRGAKNFCNFNFLSHCFITSSSIVIKSLLFTSNELLSSTFNSKVAELSISCSALIIYQTLYSCF